MSRLQCTTDTPQLVPGVWDIDPGHSGVEFVAHTRCSRLRGRFTESAGTIDVGADPLSPPPW
jgi:polyisoprenoid-binding protein YceI